LISCEENDCCEYDLRSGNGTCLYPNGERYEGTWEYDERNGHGKHFYSNGQVFEGNWEMNKREGSGNLFFKNGSLKVSGIWENDEIKI